MYVCLSASVCVKEKVGEMERNPETKNDFSQPRIPTQQFSASRNVLVKEVILPTRLGSKMAVDESLQEFVGAFRDLGTSSSETQFLVPLSLETIFFWSFLLTLLYFSSSYLLLILTTCECVFASLFWCGHFLRKLTEKGSSKKK